MLPKYNYSKTQYHLSRSTYQSSNALSVLAWARYSLENLIFLLDQSYLVIIIIGPLGPVSNGE